MNSSVKKGLVAALVGALSWLPMTPAPALTGKVKRIIRMSTQIAAQQMGMDLRQQEIQEVVDGVEDTVNELERLRALDHRLLGGSSLINLRARMQEVLSDLHEVSQYGEAVAYSHLELLERYKAVHPSWETYQQGADYDELISRYQGWITSNHDSVLGALRAAQVQSKQLADENRMMRMIESKTRTAAGTNQLLQLGSSIGNIQVDQLQKLRQLQMAHMQLQAAQAGSQIDQQAEAAVGHLRTFAPVEFTKPGDFTGLKLDGPFR